MDELEFYDGAWTGQEIDAGIGLTGTLANALAVVVDGNKSAVSATIGQYVLVKNSTITGISDGLYKAAKALPANTTLDGTYFSSAVTAGGLNDLKAAIPNVTYFASYNVTGTEMDVTIPYVENFKCFLFGYITRADTNNNGLMMVSLDHLIRYNTEIHIRNAADSTGADYGIVKYKNATTLTLSTSDPGNKFIYILGIRSL